MIQSLALAAAEANPTSETERVYIDLLPGVYREQVVVKTPYVTIRKKAGTEGEAKITWYYGLGTLYDSCNSSGYYDATVIGDGQAYAPKDWGPAVKVDKNSTAFTAENITMENSYNKYYTQEELTDIAGVDLATSTANAGNDAVDQTRFIRWGVHAGWKQMNMFPNMNNRINGDKTRFDKNSTMANKWYRIVADIDLVNKTITTTLYNRDNDMKILNGKPFEIDAPDAEGNNPNYPTDINLDNLYFNIYMDKKANASTKMEYYFDNITVEYQDYE